MSKVEIAVFAFLFGMATMNELHIRKERIFNWIDKHNNKN